MGKLEYAIVFKNKGDFMKKRKVFLILMACLIALCIMSCEDNHSAVDGGSSSPGGATHGFIVTFNSNGATSGTVAPMTVTPGERITLPSGSELFRTGYFFTGWSTTQSGAGFGNIHRYAGETFVFNLSENLTFIAMWFPTILEGTYSAYVSSVSVTHSMTFRRDGSATYTQTSQFASSPWTGNGRYTISQNRHGASVQILATGFGSPFNYVSFWAHTVEVLFGGGILPDWWRR